MVDTIRQKNDFLDGYKKGWHEARDMINWELKALETENSHIKLENRQLSIAINNIRRFLKC